MVGDEEGKLFIKEITKENIHYYLYLLQLKKIEIICVY